MPNTHTRELESGAGALESILRALASLRIPAAPGEYDLHALIRVALDSAGINYAHEVYLAPRCRVDFLSGDIAIEVKKGKPVKTRLVRQAQRYLACVRVNTLIVVSQKNVLLPRELLGKRVILVSLDRLWGVALP